jgi:hypothetical protein
MLEWVLSTPFGQSQPHHRASATQQKPPFSSSYLTGAIGQERKLEPVDWNVSFRIANRTVALGELDRCL